ncbi:tetratricopeptide repeat protein [Actinacidiphila sp. bgisy160]|uniref:tetratricopeptide repeat protein n=1 Tax=Actinacidiphila sp. bgisy160 TaxID=3413796 RepID=UPI003D716BED
MNENDQGRDELLAAAVALREHGEAEAARQRLVALAERFPGDAEVAYQAAWAHDVLGLEAEAVPFYELALRGAGLSEEDRRGALLGLGSTYRVLGRYDEAVRLLRVALIDFPHDGALRTFLAMALYNTGGHREAMRILLTLLADSSSDPDIARYRGAVAYYAEDLDATL